MRPESTSKAPLTVWTVGACCPKKQPIYREQFLQVVNPNGKMFLIYFLGTKPAHVPTKNEAFLDEIFQPAGEAELLVDLSWEWKRVVSCLCSPCQCKTQLAVRTSCASVAVLSARTLGTCQLVEHLGLVRRMCRLCSSQKKKQTKKTKQKNNKKTKGRLISSFFLKGNLAPLKPCSYESNSP